ncbi:MAG: hypothetical protein ABSF29_00005 [Tepidisphaeraceae bacterium]
MHGARVGLGCVMAAVLLGWASSLYGQVAGVSEKFLVDCTSSVTWTSGNTNILELFGPVSIEMDNLKMRADRAVVWLSPEPGALLGEQEADIVLIGNAVLRTEDNNVTRSGGQLKVSATVRGLLRITADRRDSLDDSGSDLYRQAETVRELGAGAEESGGSGMGPPPATRPGGAAEGAILPPTTSGTGVIQFHAGLAQQLVLTDDSVVVVVSGGLSLTQARVNGDFEEMQSERGVLFTSLKGEDLLGGGNMSDLGKKITAAYLEGDVRINFTPVAPGHAEQRLTADRVYYEFAGDRALLTNVVLHTIDPRTQIPVIIRAETMHQLAEGEYTAKGATMTTSSFEIPSVAVRASDLYVRQVPGPDREVNNNFVGYNDTLNLFGLPVFYLPVAAGNVSNDPFPLRNISTSNTTRYGFTVNSQWGLFESLGERPPPDLDVSYRLDNFSKRGFGGGLDGLYNGGFIDDTTLQPWNFQGDFKSYLMTDRGVDNLGGARTDVDPATETRGRFLWEHEHFFPDDWQIQIRAGYVSDPTFLEEYYQPDFDDGLPHDLSFYVKHQKDDEAFTFLGETDSTNFVTNAAQQPEQFDVQRIPEVSYEKIGDSVFDDQATWISENSASGLRFQKSQVSLADQGFGPGLSPGLPSSGLTGTTSGVVWRGDTRQELDWPVAVGQIKVVPYVMEEVTTYSSSPEGDPQTRFYTGGGFRMSTAFWNVDDTAESDLLDIHRVRTIIEPEVNLYGSGTTLDNTQVYDFDPNIDAINDIQAAQVALHETWQTMRGGPAGWRSVDFLQVNVEGNFFANKPAASELDPTQFRGLFFPAMPEDSVPRQGINADATWNVSDSTALLADDAWSLDGHELATASAGIAAYRDQPLSYYVDDRYVQVLHSQVVSFSSNYQLTRKYTVQYAQSFDFGQTNDVSSTISVIRQFDSFSLAVTVFHDATTNQSGFNVNLIPLGVRGPTGGLQGLVTPQ